MQPRVDLLFIFCLRFDDRSLRHSEHLSISLPLQIFGVWMTVRYRNQKDPRANPSAFL